MNGNLNYTEAKRLYEAGELSQDKFEWFEAHHQEIVEKQNKICNYYGITLDEFHKCLANMHQEITDFENINGTPCITLEELPEMLSKLRDACISVTGSAAGLEKSFLFDAVCYCEAWELYLQHPNSEVFVRDFPFQGDSKNEI